MLPPAPAPLEQTPAVLPRGALPAGRTPLSCPARLPGRSAGSPPASPAYRRGRSSLLLCSLTLEPQLQGFCNINHQSRFLPRLRKPGFSSPAALLFQQRAGTLGAACPVSATAPFAACPNEICPATCEPHDHKSNQGTWVFMAKRVISIHQRPPPHPSSLQFEITNLKNVEVNELI